MPDTSATRPAERAEVVALGSDENLAFFGVAYVRPDGDTSGSPSRLLFRIVSCDFSS